MFPRECRAASVSFFDVDMFVFKQTHYHVLQRGQTQTPRHTLHPAHPRLPLYRFRKVGVVVGHIRVLTHLFTLPRSTRSISSSPRPGWTPACATTAAAPGCRLLPSTGKPDSLRTVVVKAQSSVRHNPDIGNNGVLGFKQLRSNSESLLRVFLSLQAPTCSY